MQNKYKLFIVVSGVIALFSCTINPDLNRSYHDQTKVYKLTLNPSPAMYYYSLSNQTETEIEAEGKKMSGLNKSSVSLYYQLHKDSSKNFRLAISYDKIHIYSRNGDRETEMDADNDNATFNPAERVLGYLKNAKLMALLTPNGSVIDIQGYNEIGQKIIASFDANDLQGKKIAQQQWDKVIGEKFVKKNIDQLFKIFPDSAIHIGDTWKIDDAQSDGGLASKNIFKLKAINDEIAIIQSEGNIANNIAGVGLDNFNGATVDLKGQQHGEYEIETKTGMLISCRIEAKVQGTVEINGNEFPLTIETSVKVTGRKIR